MRSCRLSYCPQVPIVCVFLLCSDVQSKVYSWRVGLYLLRVTDEKIVRTRECRLKSYSEANFIIAPGGLMNVYEVQSNRPSCFPHQNGIGDSTLYGPDGPAQGGGAATGAEIVSPLVSTGNVHVHGTGRGPKHPGWGFGYNGSDPRVRFEPQASERAVQCRVQSTVLCYCW